MKQDGPGLLKQPLMKVANPNNEFDNDQEEREKKEKENNRKKYYAIGFSCAVAAILVGIYWKKIF